MRKIINVLLIAAALIVAFNTVNMLRSPYRTEVARFSTVKKSVSATGIVVRDEKIIDSASSGVLETNIADGERVSHGQYLGAVVSGAYDTSAASELENINTRIADIKNNGGMGDIYAADTAQLNMLLSERIKALTSASARENFKDAASGAEQIALIMSRKSEGGQKSPTKKLLAELEGRKSALLQSLGGTRQELYAPTAGVFESATDGFETVAVPSVLSSITPSFVEQLMKMDTEGNTTGICKIVNNYEWYIAANISEEKLSDVESGSEVSLAFEGAGDDKVAASIIYISPPEEGICAVAFRSNRYVPEITSMRQASFEVQKATYSGIHVPLSAIRILNGETGVYVLSDGRESFRTFREIYRTEEFCLVGEKRDGTTKTASIALYDEIILNPKSDAQEAT